MLKNSKSVTVFDLKAEVVNDLVSAGAKKAATIADVAKGRLALTLFSAINCLVIPTLCSSIFHYHHDAAGDRARRRSSSWARRSVRERNKKLSYH